MAARVVPVSRVIARRHRAAPIRAARGRVGCALPRRTSHTDGRSAFFCGHDLMPAFAPATVVADIAAIWAAR